MLFNGHRCRWWCGIDTAGGVASTVGGQGTFVWVGYKMRVQMAHLFPNALGSLLGDGR